MQDFSFITAWVDNSLRAIMPGWLAVTTECVLVGVGLLLVYALPVSYTHLTLPTTSRV